uniref:Uncharacterized protein n=1 Tax=Corethron hystrix TaxID=216773 RepID=A0A7S1BW58_9STRA|mmetsp:Transcript_4162/g.8052  ORF Transcript_4162/g.8052 Transcript_4162/m.8052 type:complete len:140 (+) Transcript_4162:298-717(+)
MSSDTSSAIAGRRHSMTVEDARSKYSRKADERVTDRNAQGTANSSFEVPLAEIVQVPTNTTCTLKREELPRGSRITHDEPIHHNIFFLLVWICLSLAVFWPLALISASLWILSKVGLVLFSLHLYLTIFHTLSNVIFLC